MGSNPFRSHYCGDLRSKNIGERVKLSGWVHRQRDHGRFRFIDLRDHFGIVQCVIDTPTLGDESSNLPMESVICVEGKVVERSEESVNTKIPTGHVEILVDSLTLLSKASPLPLQVYGETDFPEETRLKYRYLDLRRERMHRNIELRSNIIFHLRQKMTEANFLEIQTPILTASSPEGARDYLVPSRIYPGEFYALPQAPQLFKQLLMVAGFDRYFQIAPCFRDEDSRAERSPGEFYQLDFEMAFVTQEDIFKVFEPIIADTFTLFGKGSTVTPAPFPRIAYDEAMLHYGCDKPDLRNPLRLEDGFFLCSAMDPFRAMFASPSESPSVVARALPVPQVASQSRKFFKECEEWVLNEGGKGLGYVLLQENAFKGPLAKFISEELQREAIERWDLTEGDGVFFLCGESAKTVALGGRLRNHIGKCLDLYEKNAYRFCWIVDFPMYEKDPDSNQILFSHNPFSMPQGGLEALETQDPLSIKAWQYDLVCNGIELSSGAIRNHVPEIMFKAFSIAGYTKEEVETRFSGLLNAFYYGAPPHGGCAPGIERIVMLLANEPNLREVTAFPLNQQARDVMMGAPCSISSTQLNELHLRVVLPQKPHAP